MSNVVALHPSKMPAAFRSRDGLPRMNDAAQQGLSAGFAVISLRGKLWRVKHAGEETVIPDDRGMPASYIDVIIVGISPAVSKNWFAGGFVDNAESKAPDCYSLDGVKPEPASERRQADTCLACPHNVFGTALGQDGKAGKGKACKDTRRIAVVPMDDVENDDNGGPMMLRVPVTSLRNLAQYTAELERFGAEPYMVHTRLSFDPQVTHQEIQFNALGFVPDVEVDQVMAQVNNPLINRMFNAAPETVEHTALAATGALVGAAPAAGFKPKAVTTVVAEVPIATLPAPPPPPAPAAIAEPAEDDEEAALLAKLAATRAAKAQRADPAPAAVAAPPAKKAPFGKKTPAIAAAPAEDVAQTTPAGVLTAAPADLENVIDNLLS